LFIHLHLGPPSGLFPSGFQTNILHEFLSSPFVLHALPTSSPLTWSFYLYLRRVQVMKLFIMQFSTVSCHSTINNIKMAY
jgi:hypothetical protein